MKDLLGVLRKAGHPGRVLRMADGTRVLVLPHGGRVLGLFPPKSGENFYWTHPALRSAATARAFYASDDWHNSGGDRTWLAPEADLFLPNYPKLDVYFQPRSLDPGQYRVIESAGGFGLVAAHSVVNCIIDCANQVTENAAQVAGPRIQTRRNAGARLSVSRGDVVVAPGSPE